MNWLEYVTYRYFIAPLAPSWCWPTDREQPDDWERIGIERPDGGKLVGLYGPAISTPKGTVVCAHPTHKAAKGFFLRYGHARMMRNAGYHVLLFDFGGFGESVFHDLQYPDEVLAAGREAQRCAPGLPVAVYGVCSGAAWALCACTHADHPFTAAVLESPLTSFLDYYRPPLNGQRSKIHIFHRIVARALIRVWRKYYPEKAPPLRPIDYAPRLHNLEDLLLIYGTRDTYIPLTLGRQLADACSLPADLWEVSGGMHLRAPVADPETYRVRVTDCFDRAFTRRAGRKGGNGYNNVLADPGWIVEDGSILTQMAHSAKTRSPAAAVP